MFIRKYGKYKDNAKGEPVCILREKCKPKTSSLQIILRFEKHSMQQDADF